MEGTVGEIRIFSGLFQPQNWLFCDGRILQIDKFQILFSILGNTYGGDSLYSFALPNLVGRAPVGEGDSREYRLGKTGGSTRQVITNEQMPPHTHLLKQHYSYNIKCGANNETGEKESPIGNYPAVYDGGSAYAQPTDGFMETNVDAAVNRLSVLPEGYSNELDTKSPFLALNYIICVEGTYPRRR
jgi:microcystin-dependent protein